MTPVRKAVIPAAGLGTRFLPATKAQPKEMLPVVDKPAIQYVVEEAVRSGIDDILIITGRGKKAIEDHFDESIFRLLIVLRTGKIITDQRLRTIRCFLISALTFKWLPVPEHPIRSRLTQHPKA